MVQLNSQHQEIIFPAALINIIGKISIKWQGGDFFDREI
jgi:hypothetical protein